ncbi:hypothetical protein BASA81_014895 [Batrachochytrium salamandrivorans]|nr:hypothetical protein BASA81_014895 [Batrachochytrium salamandrivorans]
MTTTTEKPSSSFVVFRQHLKGFTVGALAACGAVTFTNPWEVVKTRLQLQGELQAHQASGLYDPLKLVIQSGVDRVASNITGDPNPTNPVAPAFAMVTSGAMSGVLGALIASPLFLIKTRMQSYTKGSALAVGHQHSYVTQGTFHSLVKVFHSGGIRGLWRGVDASMMRTGVGSSVQLSSYDGCKQALLQSGWFDSSNGAEGGIGLHFVASLATSLLVCIAMNPFDVASTRMYNQHESADGKSGSLYKNGVDCLIKTVRSEGARALYKGFFANYLRVGPHTILTFVFLEQLRAAANRIELYFS